ncbi:MAG: hypothetical protein EPN84_03890 [Legionella sp.]|nr:MAG: hypothetical protein EPN84_03890 [Legionella sp.]
MKDFDVTEAEWNIARRLLKNAADGTIYPLPKTSDDTSNSTQPTFIRISDQIYAIAAGNALITNENANLQLAKNEQGQLFVIKIVQPFSSYFEVNILDDLSMLIDAHMPSDSLHYIVMPYWGDNLYNRLIDRKLTIEQRLDIAINLCWQVHRLHEGTASETHAQYAHLNLHPWNVLVEKNRNVHIVDFNSATYQPTAETDTNPDFLDWSAYAGEKLTGIQHDIIALKRILYMPTTFFCKTGFVPQTMHRGIFIEAELQDLQLKTYVDTSSTNIQPPNHHHERMTALMLTALLICAKLKLKIEQVQIVNSPNVAEAIVGLYFAKKQKQIASILANPQRIHLVAALSRTNCLQMLDVYSQDQQFLEFLDQSSSHASDSALVCLKRLGLSLYYSRVLNFYEAQNVLELTREGLGQFVEKLFTNAAQLFAINLLRNYRFAYFDLIHSFGYLPHPQMEFFPNRMDKYYQNVLTNSELANTMMRAGRHFENCPSSLFFALVINPLSISLANLLMDEGIENAAFLEYLLRFQPKNGLSAIRLIKEMKKLGFSNLYANMAENRELVSDFSILFNCDFKRKLTNDMLVNDQLRRILRDYLRHNSDKFPVFLNLYEDILLQQQKQPDKHWVTLLETTALLNKRNVKTYRQLLLDNPACVQPLWEFLREDKSALIDKKIAFMNLLKTAPTANRFELLQTFAGQEDLRTLYKKYPWDWRELKKLLLPAEVKMLQQQVFTEEEFKAKVVLGKIKTKITQTQWPTEASTQQYFYKSTFWNFPGFIANQAAVLQNRAQRRLTHVEALARVKEIGCEEAQQRDGVGSAIKHGLFGKTKSKTQLYAEAFASDDVFDMTFG